MIPKLYNIKLTSSDDWDIISQDILHLENNIFSKNYLNEDEEDLKLQFTNPQSITHLALDETRRIRGYSSAGPLENYIDVPFVKNDLDLHKEDSFYLWSICVHPNFCKRGIGNSLIDSLIKEMKLKGFNRLTGHFLQSSQNLMLSRGAKILEHEDNWYNSGLAIDYMALNL